MMNVLKLPPAIQRALDRSDDVSTWIRSHQPQEVPAASLNARLAAPYLAICLDHREAIRLLLEHDSRSAAFALWRSVYEALIGSQWAEACATERDVDQIAATFQMPTIDTMVKRLDALEPGAGDSSYGVVKRKVWNRMSHFAHGGFQQLARWAGPAGIAPRHPNAEVVELLWLLDVYGLLACMALSRLAGQDTAEYEVKVRQCLDAPPA